MTNVRLIRSGDNSNIVSMSNNSSIHLRPNKKISNEEHEMTQLLHGLGYLQTFRLLDSFRECSFLWENHGFTRSVLDSLNDPCMSSVSSIDDVVIATATDCIAVLRYRAPTAILAHLHRKWMNVSDTILFLASMVVVQYDKSSRMITVTTGDHCTN